MDIFLSYSRRNTDFTRMVAQQLKDASHEVWVDWEDIPFSSDWWREIIRGMDGCQAIVLVVTPDYLRSEICHREITYARSCNKRMIPIIHQEIDEEALAAFWKDQKWGEGAIANWDAVRAHNWLFCRTPEEYEKAFGNLIQTVNRDPENAHYHTRLLVRAREWQNSEKPGGGRDESLLLRGDELRRAESWLQFNRNQEPRPTSLHSIYIGASVALRQEEDDRAKQQTGRLRQLVGLLSVFLIMAIGLGVLAVTQSQAAQVSAQTAIAAVATSDSSAATARANLRGALEAQALYRGERAQAQIIERRPQVALLLALEALENYEAGIYNTNSQLALSRALTSSVQEVAYFPHDSTVSLAAWSVDRQRVATVSAFTITVWNASTSRKIATLNHASTAFVRGVVFSVDGQRLLSWDSEGVARVWNIRTAESIGLRHPSPDLLNTAVFSPDERRVLSASEDGSAIVWDAETGAQLATLTHDSAISGAAFSADGAYTLTWGRDRTVRVWDMRPARPTLKALFPHDANVRGATFSRDYTRVLSWTRGPNAYIWQIDSPSTPLHTLTHNDQVNTALFDTDEARILTASADGQARLWSANDGRLLASYPHESGLDSAVFADSDARIVTVTNTGQVVLWRTDTTATPIQSLSEAAMQRVIVSSDGQRVLAWSGDNAKLWDVTQNPPTALEMRHYGEVYGAIWDEANRRVLTWGDDRTARIWRVGPSGEPRLYGATGRLSGALLDPLRTRVVVWSDATLSLYPITNLLEQPAVFEHSAPIDGVVWSPTGARIASWTDGSSEALVWTTNQADQEPLRLYHTRRIAGATWSEDGSLLVTWDVGGVGVAEGSSVTAWTIDSLDPIRADGANRVVLPHTGLVGGAIISPNADSVVTWAGAEVLVWSLTAEAHRTLQHDASVAGVTFSANGSRLLSWGFDNTARIWDFRTGQELSRLTHAGAVSGAALSADGQRVLTWSADATIRIWEVESGLLLYSMPHEVVLQGQNFPLSVLSAAWSEDEGEVLSLAIDGQARVWTLNPDRTAQAVILRHEGNIIREAAWDNDGQRVLTWDEGQSVRVWDTTQDYRTIVLPHPNGLRGASWIADPTRLLTWSNDGARLWLVDVPSMLAVAEAQRVRSLSNEERAALVLPTYTPSPTLAIQTQTPMPSLTPSPTLEG
jgi:WD40 repeat protein